MGHVDIRSRGNRHGHAEPLGERSGLLANEDGEPEGARGDERHDGGIEAGEVGVHAVMDALRIPYGYPTGSYGYVTDTATDA